MLSKSLLCLVVLFLVFASGIVFAEEARVEIEGRYWVTDLDAKVKAVEAGIGEKFDFKSDLGIGDENFPEARIYWHNGPNSKIRLTYTQVDFHGDQAINRSIQFEGQTFTVGAKVVSDLDIKYFSLGWIWQFIGLAQEKIKLGTIVEVKGISAEVSLDAPDLSPALKESEQFIGGLPTVGLALDINPIKKINLFAEFSGLGAGDLGYFFDGEAGIEFSPFKYLSIKGGYRVIGVKVEDSSDFARLDLKGPFFGVALKF